MDLVRFLFLFKVVSVVFSVNVTESDTEFTLIGSSNSVDDQINVTTNPRYLGDKIIEEYFKKKFYEDKKTYSPLENEISSNNYPEHEIFSIKNISWPIQKKYKSHTQWLDDIPSYQGYTVPSLGHYMQGTQQNSILEPILTLAVVMFLINSIIGIVDKIQLPIVRARFKEEPRLNPLTLEDINHEVFFNNLEDEIKQVIEKYEQKSVI